MRVGLLIAVVVALAPLSAQDLEYERALERAQALKPQRLASVARIAPEGEPGTPLVIRGRVYQPDGRTPAPGITVFAYHTDRTGVYDVRSNGPHSWRLKGWAITDAEGRFEFRTIRPGAYPGRAEPQHVHFSIEGPSVPRQSPTALEFEDDPKIGPREREESRRAGIFGGVRPVTRRDGIDHVEINLRIATRGLLAP
jgi:protocatechuate 3,4-dioxygenase beta subunit